MRRSGMLAFCPVRMRRMNTLPGTQEPVCPWEQGSQLMPLFLSAPDHRKVPASSRPDVWGDYRKGPGVRWKSSVTHPFFRMMAFGRNRVKDASVDYVSLRFYPLHVGKGQHPEAVFSWKGCYHAPSAEGVSPSPPDRSGERRRLCPADCSFCARITASAAYTRRMRPRGAGGAFGQYLSGRRIHEFCV